MKRMTKMEAVGALCEIKRDIDDELTLMQARLDKTEKGDMSTYERERIEQRRQWSRAIEMAGKAMTR